MTDWNDMIASVQEHAERTFGEPLSYTATDGSVATGIPGIFRDEHAAQDLGLEVDVDSIQPTVDVRRSDLPARPRRGDLVVLDSRPTTPYRVERHESDGEGIFKLFLHEDV